MNVSLLQSIVFHVPKNAADDRQPAFFSPSAEDAKDELPYVFFQRLTACKNHHTVIHDTSP